MPERRTELPVSGGRIIGTELGQPRLVVDGVEYLPDTNRGAHLLMLLARREESLLEDVRREVTGRSDRPTPLDSVRTRVRSVNFLEAGTTGHKRYLDLDADQRSVRRGDLQIDTPISHRIREILDATDVDELEDACQALIDVHGAERASAIPSGAACVTNDHLQRPVIGIARAWLQAQTAAIALALAKQGRSKAEALLSGLSLDIVAGPMPVSSARREEEVSRTRSRTAIINALPIAMLLALVRLEERADLDRRFARATASLLGTSWHPRDPDNLPTSVDGAALLDMSVCRAFLPFVQFWQLSRPEGEAWWSEILQMCPRLQQSLRTFARVPDSVETYDRMRHEVRQAFSGNVEDQAYEKVMQEIGVGTAMYAAWGPEERARDRVELAIMIHDLHDVIAYLPDIATDEAGREIHRLIRDNKSKRISDAQLREDLRSVARAC